MVSVEGGGGDILGGKKASYRDYVDLWMHLMDPTHLRVSVHHGVLQYSIVYYSILEYITVYYSILQYITVYDSTLPQYTLLCSRLHSLLLGSKCTAEGPWFKAVGSPDSLRRSTQRHSQNCASS